MRPSRHLPLVILLGLLVRVPFWIEALKTPVDGDTAIVGLMAKHLGEGTSFWSQRYGSPLDAWIAKPFLAAIGFTPQALRLTYFLLGLALIPAAYALAGELHPWAALPAGVLMACPPPYFLLLSALPPPLYPTTLLLCVALLLLAFRAGERLRRGDRPPLQLAAWGGLAGLAVWTHLMSLGTVLASGLWLVFRARGRRIWLAVAAVPLLLVSLPWWSRALTEPGILDIARASRPEQSALDHLVRVAPRLLEPLGGLLGTHVPLIADTSDHVIRGSWMNGFALALIYGALFIQALRASRQGGPARALIAVVGLALVAFLVPLRSSAHTIRFLTPLYLPLLALVAWAPVSAGRPRRGWIAILSLAVLHLTPGTRLLAAWRSADRREPPFLLIDLNPIRRVLSERGIRHAYASYGPAFRLAFESNEAVIASPPWNERIRHGPLPYLDQVRFAKNVAWILIPKIPGELPTPAGFEKTLAASGGGWQRSDTLDAAIFRDFTPPFAPTVLPWPDAGAASDGDPRTSRALDPVTPTVLRLPSARSLDAVTLVAPLEGDRLFPSMDVEVSADGTAFEVVAQRRRRQERLDLRWVNGHPQAVLDHDLLAIPLGGRSVLALRIVPLASAERGALGEVLVHPASGPGPRPPWDEWLDPHLGWIERLEQLRSQPRPNREDWYWRMLLAERHARRRGAPGIGSDPVSRYSM